MKTGIKHYLLALIIVGLAFVSWVGVSELVGAATIVLTPATSTIGEFRTNVNTSLTNLNAGASFTTTTINDVKSTTFTFATSGAAGLFITTSTNTLTFRVATSTDSVSG